MNQHINRFIAAVAVIFVFSTIAQAADEPVAADQNLEVVDIKLPKPAYQGTPKQVPPDTTAERPTGPRPAFKAPKGTANVAGGCKVNSSDPEPIIGDLPFLTDGNKEGGEGNFVELGPGVQWAQIDLGKPVSIYAVVVWHRHTDPRVYRDVVVQTADDADFITNVQTLFNNDQDNSAGLGIGKDREYFESFEGKLIDARGAKARYLRLYSKGSTADEMNHYTEVEVYGIPAE